MKEIKLTNRQKELLKIIVEQYINNAEPISSKEIIEKFFTDLSSATIRNEMVVLEKNGLIEKTYTSSGRVPSRLGYDYYRSNFLQPVLSSNLKQRLNKIFAKRLTSIEAIINESMDVINETLKLPSVVTTSQLKETLKRLDLIPINNNLAIIILVTSSGNVTKNTITFNESKILQDISTCIRIFNDRLVDTPIEELAEKIETIKPIVENSVENYEYIMQEMVNRIFNIKYQFHTQVHGTKYLTSQPEFKDIKKLNEVLDMLDQTTIWQHIAYNQAKSGKTTLITSGNQMDGKDLAIASVNVVGGNNCHQISVIGPSRMNYAKIEGILDFLKEEIEKKYHE